MRPTDILDKSEKGQEEIRTRKHKLAGKARMLLLLVDGRHPIFILREQAAKMSLPADTLDLLIAEGYVEARQAQLAPEPAAAGPAAPAATEATAAAETAAPAAPAPDGERFNRYSGARRLMTESVFSALGLKGFFFTLKIEKTANLDDLRTLVPEYDRLMTKAMSAEAATLFVSRLHEMVGA